jgi:HAD superfamily phosphatase (TIGR01668 family)
MRLIETNENSPLFVPNFVADSVLDIDFESIRKHGVKYVAFDADSTLVGYRKKLLDEETRKYLHKKLKIFNGVCIASNRVTNDLDKIADDINASVIRASLTKRKPSFRFFERVINHFDARPGEIAMIGDKLIADIYGGNKAGLVTIWVNRKGKDSIFDRMLQTRRFERRMTKRHVRRR